jgi:hypothetical protein
MIDVNCPIIWVRQQQVMHPSCFVAEAFISHGFVADASVVGAMFYADNSHDAPPVLGLNGRIFGSIKVADVKKI